jgi:hypothetical protein
VSASSPAPAADSAGRWDVTALREGASVAVLCAVPFTVIARLAFDDDDKSGWTSVLALATFAGFILGAGVAAWRQERGTPLLHGVTTAVGVFVAVQVVFAVLKVLRGESVNGGRIAVSFSLAALAGLIGGMLGSFLQRQGMAPRR